MSALPDPGTRHERGADVTQERDAENDPERDSHREPEPAGDPRPAGPNGVAAAHPTADLNETVHQRHRLGILTITAEADSADFGYLRDALGLTPGNLSRHLTVLEEAGLVRVSKGFRGRRPRTWVRITRKGRSALAAEIAALTELLRRHGTTAAGDGRRPDEA